MSVSKYKVKKMSVIFKTLTNITQRTLGSGEAALTVSPLGFGCMGMTHHRGPIKERASMVRLLKEAVDCGCTFFDTAEIYGPFNNEELVGEALGDNSSIFVATKFGHAFDVNEKPIYGALDSSPKRIRKVCEASLKRLKRDVIDVFYQHRVDPKVPPEVVAETVKDLVKEGKVRHFGLCEASAEVIRRSHKIFSVTVVQSEYHLMWREAEYKIFPTLEEFGIGFVPYSPLNRGFLAGSITPGTTFAAVNDNRSSLPRFTPDAISKNFTIVEKLKDFGNRHELSVAQVQLGWALSKKPWIVPIPGTTRAEHMKENFASGCVLIDEREWKTLEDEIMRQPIVGSRYGKVEAAQVC